MADDMHVDVSTDDDRSWSRMLEEAAAHDDASVFDVRDDIERGRRRLRRTHVAVGGTGLLVGALILGTGLLFGGGSGPGAQVDPGPAGGDDAPTRVEPQRVLNPQPSEPPSEQPSKQPMTAEDYMDEIDQTTKDTKEWREGVFDITASVLDPEKRYLNYSTQSLQYGGGSLGIKMGWSVPGQAGEGMVQLSVASGRPQGCALAVGVTCHSVTLPNGEQVREGDGADGAFAVMYTQDDGETVSVTIDPLFGNNSLVPVEEMTISKQDVYRLVQDDRFNLPAGY